MHYLGNIGTRLFYRKVELPHVFLLHSLRFLSAFCMFAHRCSKMRGVHLVTCSDGCLLTLGSFLWNFVLIRQWSAVHLKCHLCFLVWSLWSQQDPSSFWRRSYVGSVCPVSSNSSVENCDPPMVNPA